MGQFESTYRPCSLDTKPIVALCHTICGEYDWDILVKTKPSYQVKSYIAAIFVMFAKVCLMLKPQQMELVCDFFARWRSQIHV